MVEKAQPLVRPALCVFLAFSLPLTGEAFAEQVLNLSNLKVEVGASAWITQGETKWDHNASGPGSPFGNPTSRLVYKDVGTNVMELSGRVKFAERWFVRTNYGFAGIGGGRLTDDDFLAADGGQPSSRTYSDIKGDSIWYVNGDLGYTLFSFPGHRGTLDLMIGYQYRREKHEATGVTHVICTTNGSTVDLDPTMPGTQPLCTPGAPPSNVGQTVITNTQTWSSLKLGVETEYRITRRLTVEGKAAFIPYTSLNNQDIHRLRSDLQQNPSFEMTGTGIGANVEGNVAYMLVRGLFVTVGYRYWWTRVTDGTWKVFPVGAPSETFNLNQFQNIRQGVTFGLTYYF